MGPVGTGKKVVRQAGALASGKMLAQRKVCGSLPRRFFQKNKNPRLPLRHPRPFFLLQVLRPARVHEQARWLRGSPWWLSNLSGRETALWVITMSLRSCVYETFAIIEVGEQRHNERLTMIEADAARCGWQRGGSFAARWRLCWDSHSTKA
jgi:hypothetical protein